MACACSCRLVWRRSDRVIVDSPSTRDDLVELLGTPPERIDVVPRPRHRPRAARWLASARLLERRASGERRVLLSLSAKLPPQNLYGSDRRDGTHPCRAGVPCLVLPRRPHRARGFGFASERSRLACRASFSFLDWLSGEDLEGLWQVTEAFVYPSLY